MKGYIRKVFAVTSALFRTWQADWRIWFVFLLEGFQVLRYLSGLLRFGLANGTDCTPFMLAFLFSDGSIANGLLKIQLYFGLVILLCNAPFRNSQTQYLVIRSGKRAWWQGVCLYIISASFLYVLFLALVSTLAVLPTVSFRPVWGSTIQRIMELGSEAKFTYGRGIIFPEELIDVVYPWAVQGLIMLTAWLNFSLLGLLICVVNELSGQMMFGCGAAAFFVLLDPVVRWLAYVRSRFWWYYASPVSWTSIEHWDFLGMMHPLHGATVLAVSVLLILLLSAVGGYIVRGKEVVVQERVE